MTHNYYFIVYHAFVLCYRWIVYHALFYVHGWNLGWMHQPIDYGGMEGQADIENLEQLEKIQTMWGLGTFIGCWKSFFGA